MNISTIITISIKSYLVLGTHARQLGVERAPLGGVPVCLCMYVYIYIYIYIYRERERDVYMYMYNYTHMYIV